MTTENLSRADAAARASHITIDSYRVSLDLGTDEKTFGTESTIVFSATSSSTFLDFLGESVDEVIVNGKSVPVSWDGARINLEGLGESNEVTVRARGRYSRSGEGLHRFVDPVDGGVYLYTQFEPADARRLFANMEQPNLKASFTFDVTAPAEWTVLNNTTCERTEEVGDRRRHFFTPTKRMSTYLTAVVAGPYHRVNCPDDERFSAFCRASISEYFDHEEIFDISLSGLKVFEEAFGMAYPWGKYDQVFVPEYNLGAMENPGLVTFTEDYIFRGHATRAQHAARANTILHEMSHMWFGDLATPVWWDDLWLKESFAEFMGAWASVAATEFTEAWVAFSGARTNWAFVNDMRPTTHPIIADIPDLEAADQNFDGITYAKGAAVLRQLVAYVGEDAFFAGARSYFDKHAYSNTTLTDLLTELEAASGRDLAAWADEWLKTSGPSTIEVRGDSLVQTGADPRTGEEIRRPHTISVGAYELENDEWVRRDAKRIDITNEATIPLAGSFILPNDTGETYAIIRLDEAGTEGALTHRIADPLARAVAWMSLWQAVRAGALDPARYLEGVSRFHDEADSSLLASLIANCAYLVERYSSDRSAVRERWAEICHEAYLAARSDGAADLQHLWRAALARAGAVLPDRAEDLREALGEVTDDHDARWQLLIGLAATGQVTREQLDEELGENPAEADRISHLTAVSALPGKRRAAYERAMSEDLSNDEISALLTGATARYEAESFPVFDIAEPVWESRSQKIAERILYALMPTEESGIEAGSAWLTGEGAKAPAALRKIVIDCIDTLERDRMVRSAH
ncbi:MAG: aminopeptidase N [Flaviflexus sp.]|nr:aminopeptidase N [Flaviflexus sp.]